jgi:HNH endonuclease
VTLTSLQEQRFNKYVQRNIEINNCWLCQKNLNNEGYGQIKISGKRFLLHRISYAVFKGDFDDNLDVLHRCDIKNCINPEHLFLGTQANNMADRDAKGRQAKGEKNGRYSPVAKLTDIQIKEIRHLKAETRLSQKEIAQIFHVSRPLISCILRGKRWKHVA